MIEKKTNAALSATQDKNRICNELGELRDQVDIKDRKVNVLQRKVRLRRLDFNHTNMLKEFKHTHTHIDGTDIYIPGAA